MPISLDTGSRGLLIANMNRVVLMLLVSLLSTGCTVVAKQGYFTPDVEPLYKSGPHDNSCGFYSGGLPDTYVDNINGQAFTITAKQYFHPYFWGPWIFSVVPVFPITWILAPNDDLEIAIEIETKEKVLRSLEDFTYSITLTDADNKTIAPSSVNVYLSRYYTSAHIGIKFPVKYDTVNGFVFHIKGKALGDKDINIHFIKASRWSWNQFSINC